MSLLHQQVLLAQSAGSASAPTFRAATKKENGNLKNWSITVPTGVQAGDLLELQVLVHGSVTMTITPPSGFTAAETITDWVTNATFARLKKVAVGSYSGGATFTGSFNAYNNGSVLTCCAFVGANATENATAHTNHGTNASSPIAVTVPGVTTTAANCLQIASVALLHNGDYSNEAAPFTWGSGLSELIVAKKDDMHLGVAYKTLVASGATGDLSVTVTHNYGYRQSKWCASDVTLAPA